MLHCSEQLREAEGRKHGGIGPRLTYGPSAESTRGEFEALQAEIEQFCVLQFFSRDAVERVTNLL